MCSLSNTYTHCGTLCRAPNPARAKRCDVMLAEPPNEANTHAHVRVAYRRPGTRHPAPGCNSDHPAPTNPRFKANTITALLCRFCGDPACLSKITHNKKHDAGSAPVLCFQPYITEVMLRTIFTVVFSHNIVEIYCCRKLYET